MNDVKDFTYKERDRGHKELLSMLIYRPFAKFLLNRMFKNSNLTPNQISFISLVLVLIGCVFFAFSPYPYMLMGFLFLHLGYAFDMLDGVYARYKELSSKYGKWFDPFLDTIKVAFLFISLSYGSFLAKGNPLVLLWGMMAMANSLITYYVMNTKEHVIKETTFQVKISNNVYLGYEISLYWALLIMGLFDAVYIGMLLLGTVGAFTWIKLYVSFRREYYSRKDEIESEV